MNKKIFGLAAFMLVILIAPVYASNISIMYGWNGTSFVPLLTDANGQLQTNLNLTESIGMSPELNNTYDLGTAAMLWANLYVRSLRGSGQISVIGDMNVTGALYGNFVGDGSQITNIGSNLSLNYGWNGTNWLPLSTTSDGTLRLSVRDSQTTNASALTSSATGSDLTLTGNLITSNINVTGTTANSTFSGDVRIFGTLYGGSPLKVGGGLNVTGGIIYTTIVNTVDNVSLNINNTLFVNGSNVGIGTATPSQTLEINGTESILGSEAMLIADTPGTTRKYMRLSNTGAQLYLGIGGSAANSLSSGIAAYSGEIGTGNEKPFHIVTNDTARVTVDASGSVGIGTASPGAKLSLQSSGTAVTSLLLGNDNGATGDYNQIVFQNTQTNAYYFAAIRQYVVSGGAHGSDLAFLTETTGGTITERMRILNNGNVGIGTTTPNSKLEINNAATAGNLSLLRLVSDDTAAGGSSGRLEFYADGVNVGYVGGGRDVAASRSMIIASVDETNTAAGIKFVTNAGQSMLINSAGNVGIGTTDIEAWSSSYKVIEFPVAAIFAGSTVANGPLYLAGNAYYDGAWKYKSTNGATFMSLNGGSAFTFNTAPSGTIDTAITWTTPLTISNNGDVTIPGNLTGAGPQIVAAKGWCAALATHDARAYAFVLGSIDGSTTACSTLCTNAGHNGCVSSIDFNHGTSFVRPEGTMYTGDGCGGTYVSRDYCCCYD